MKISIIVIILFLATNIYSQNVGINVTGAIPNGSAILDVESTDKGLLVPRVNIADLTTAAPITTPVNSLLVYNTNTTTGIGYYYWNATTKWTKLVDASTPTDDHDWYEVGTTTAPDNINDNIFTKGKVGIGIVNPQNSLVVSNNNTINESTVIEGFNAGMADLSALLPSSSSHFGGLIQGGANGQLVLGIRDNDVNDGLLIASGDGNYTTDNTFDKAILFARNDGNIGVNTVNPYNKLHIYDKIDGVFSGLVIDNRKTYGVGTGVNETSRMLLSLSEGGIQNPNGRVMAYIEGGVLSEVTSAEGYLALGTRLSGTETEKMRILNNGNVGIGTIAPQTKLEIIGDGLPLSVSGETYVGVGDEVGLQFWQLTHNNALRVGGAMKSIKTNTYTGGVGSTYDSDLAFLSSLDGVLVEGMRLTDDGNVGVNTTTPTEKLEINGSIKITDGTQGAGKVLVSDASGKGSWGKASLDNASSYSKTLLLSSVRNSWVDGGVSVTVPSDGKYLVVYSARAFSISLGTSANEDDWWKTRLFNVTSSTTLMTFFGVNPRTNDGATRNGNGDLTASGNRILDLNAGDVIRLEYFVRGAGTSNYAMRGNSDGGSSISIVRLGD